MEPITISLARNDWPKLLHQTLDRSARVALLGIGHELRGDDAAGPTLINDLQARMKVAHSKLLLINGGPAPENQTGALRRFIPDVVLLIDAAQLDEQPGTICWLAWQDTIGLSASTHSLPIHMLAEYLTSELGCDVALIGIQPEQTAIDTPLSDSVQCAVDQLVQTLANELRLN